MMECQELVEEVFGCPRCGERRVDWLVWDDDGEQVTCSTCGQVYDPSGGQDGGDNPSTAD